MMTRNLKAEAEILASFPLTMRAVAIKLNQEGEGIKRRIWASAPGDAPQDHYVLNEEKVAIAVGLGTWSIWMELERRKPDFGLLVVGRDEWTAPQKGKERGGPVRVSTVFLGLDHGFGAHHGARHLFETMVFWKYSSLTWRYATYPQAQAGHVRVVGKVRLFLAGTIPHGELEEF